MAKKINFKPYDVFLIISFVICALDFSVVALVTPRLQPQIPLFYTLASDSAQLVNREYFYILPAFALLMSIITFIFVSISRNYDDFLLKLFTICVNVFQILISLIIIRTIWLVM